MKQESITEIGFLKALSHKRTTYVFIFALMVAIIFILLVNRKNEDIESRLSNNSHQVELTYNALIINYRSFSDSIYKNFINKPEILQLVKACQDSNENNFNKNRMELLKELRPVYEVIKYNKYEIFHFHTPEGNSLLRFHKLEQYGDNLLKFRYSIDLVIKNKNRIEGFEEGRLVNSYRFVYPLFYEDEYIGSVEASVAINQLKNEIANSFNGSTRFLLKDEVVEKEGFVNKDSTYSKSFYPNYYLYNSEGTNQGQIDGKLISKLNHEFLNKRNFNNDYSKCWSDYLKIDNSYYLMTLLPIKNIKDEQVGFIVLYQPGRFISVIRSEFRKNLVLSILFSFLIIFIFYIVNRSRYRAELAKRDLELAKIKAEIASSAKSDFLANMSHEIRTPMNGVIGMTEILKKTELNKDQAEYVEIISRSSNNLLAIINDILDFSKIEADKIEIENIPFSLQMLVEGISDILSLKANEKEINFSIYIDPEIPQELMGDPLRIRQILLNLASNAVKFTEQGEVFISCEKIVKKQEEISIQFLVKDTGIGIDPKSLEKLFNPFTQLDSSMSRRFGGTGLGLAISQKLAAQLNSKIKVKSEKGKGSEFTLSLTFKLSQNQKVTIDNEVFKGLKFLSIDDNVTNNFIIKSYIETFGGACDVLYNPEEVIGHLNGNNQYDFLLIDQMMPGQSGIELAEELLQKELKKKTRFILLSSGLGQLDNEKDIVESLFDGSLVKPIKQTQFVNLIQSVLGKPISDFLHLSDEKKEISIDLQKFKGQKVLLVEDNLINQKVAHHILDEMGFDVSIANNGLEAVNAYKSNSYDFILMDIQMPQMNGYEATQIIRKIEGNNQIPKVKEVRIIAMTANALKEDRQLCLDAGMNEYISKPFKPEKIIEVLESVMQ